MFPVQRVGELTPRLGSDAAIECRCGFEPQDFYCARGDMESRIKEQQLDLFADRTSTHWMASNQLRLWFSAFAHFLISTLRAWVLRGTELEQASIGQIRLRLFKIAARFKVSVRRIHIELCSALSSQRAFRPNSSSTHGLAYWAAARLTQTKAPTPTSRLPPLQNQLRRHCIN